MKARIKVDNAIAVLEKNLAEHITEYGDAMDVWKEDAKKAIDTFAAAFDRDSLKASATDIYVLFNRKPVDNRPNYSKYLGMLKQAKEAGQTEFECEEDEYDRIFQDEWDWRRASRATNVGYSSRK